MTATIVKQNDDYCCIEWEDETGFGQLQLKYTDDGNYLVDAEFISLEKVLQIIYTAIKN